MKIVSTTFCIVALASTLNAQQIERDEMVRSIEVVGSAEMSVVPDIIKYTITIQEYWEEEFQQGKKYEDYKTKVPIAPIEDDLITTLKEIGFTDDDMVFKNLGNFYRQQGKEFLIRKEIELNIDDYAKLQKIANTINPRGIRNMHISKISHSNIENLRKQVKKEALLAAKEKAGFLLSSINEELGRVITIQETSDQLYTPFQERMESNMMLKSADTSNQEVENFKKLEIRYEIRAVFEIKE